MDNDNYSRRPGGRKKMVDLKAVAALLDDDGRSAVTPIGRESTQFDYRPNDDLIQETSRIKSQRDLILQRIQRMEQNKARVSRNVFEKVARDYAMQLHSINELLTEKKNLLNKELNSLYMQREKYNMDIGRHREILEEAQFRHYLNEFTEEQYREVEQYESREIQHLQNEMTNIHALIKIHEELFDPEDLGLPRRSQAAYPPSPYTNARAPYYGSMPPQPARPQVDMRMPPEGYFTPQHQEPASPPFSSPSSELDPLFAEPEVTKTYIPEPLAPSARLEKDIPQTDDLLPSPLDAAAIPQPTTNAALSSPGEPVIDSPAPSPSLADLNSTATDSPLDAIMSKADPMDLIPDQNTEPSLITFDESKSTPTPEGSLEKTSPTVTPTLPDESSNYKVEQELGNYFDDISEPSVRFSAPDTAKSEEISQTVRSADFLEKTPLPSIPDSPPRAGDQEAASSAAKASLPPISETPVQESKKDDPLADILTDIPLSDISLTDNELPKGSFKEPTNPPAPPAPEFQPNTSLTPRPGTSGLTTSGGSYKLAFIEGESQVADLALGDNVAIGRSPSNDLVLNAPKVSRQHAAINKYKDKYILIDLKSSNGVFVNGRKVDEHSLEEGDEVSIGGFRFTFKKA